MIKRILAFVVSTIMVLPLAACSGDNKDTGKSDSASSVETTEATVRQGDVALVLNELVKKSLGCPFDWEKTDSETVINALLWDKKEYLYDTEELKKFYELPVDAASRTGYFKNIVSQAFTNEDYANNESLRALDVNFAAKYLEVFFTDSYSLYDIGSVVEFNVFKALYFYSPIIIDTERKRWTRDVSGVPALYEFKLSQIVNNETDLLINAAINYNVKTEYGEDGEIISKSVGTDILGTAAIPVIVKNQNKDIFSEKTVMSVLNCDENYAKAVYDFVQNNYSNSINVSRCDLNCVITELNTGKELFPKEGYTYKINWN